MVSMGTVPIRHVHWLKWSKIEKISDMITYYISGNGYRRHYI